ncbi:hypothetical protein FOVG_19785 [Fusarium oxysporum f. sp. pisi HDV247]|uniref:Uncharacterized protein n=1 Tax=Fusarium oxysporum f. sp. pisi HDV247 TaxID=1080344 RepID=W9N799_FUSOX|nr:hypothetical protein FOVG_19785 [Fusarium oxysporum f. sp. pisi HDV247]
MDESKRAYCRYACWSAPRYRGAVYDHRGGDDAPGKSPKRGVAIGGGDGRGRSGLSFGRAATPPAGDLTSRRLHAAPIDVIHAIPSSSETRSDSVGSAKNKQCRQTSTTGGVEQRA